MRFSLISALVAVLPAVASGGPAHSVIEPRTLDAPCRTLAEVPDDARTVTPTLGATISSANCMAMIRTRALVLKPGPAAVDALNVAVQPSLSLLDAVIRTGDVRAQILAEHAKADLYAGLRARLLSLVTPLSPTTTGAALAEHDNRLADLDTLAQPWREHASDAYRAVAQLGSSAPDVVSRDPVLAFAVSDSQFERSTLTARR